MWHVIAETRISETCLIRPKFVHLRTHSAYSLLEGALPVKTLTQTALASSAGLAETDRNNLFGALEFAETAAGLGVQPIIGATKYSRRRNSWRFGVWSKIRPATLIYGAYKRGISRAKASKAGRGL